MKNYIVEFIGTFFLVLVVALTGNPIAIGSVLMVMIYMGGYVSGAHYNPAVTLGLMMRKKISSSSAMMYMVFQLLGGMVAALVSYYLSGKSFAANPGAGVDFMKALVNEIIFTFALVSVVYGSAVAKKNSGNSFYGLAIGFTVLAAAFAGGGISGGAYNPAVGVGPILVDMILGGGASGNNGMANIALYILGPCIGGALAAVVYGIINGDE